MKNANPVFRAAFRSRGASAPKTQSRRGLARLFAALLVCSLGLAGCGPGRTAEDKGPKTVNDHFSIAVGGKVVRMQLAVRRAEMERGLMERRDLGRNDGMLFVYEKPQPLQFWMRNTPTPLDIGFFDPEGKLQEIYPLHPHDEKPVESRHDRLQFALEVNQGWYRENGVKPGAPLDLQAVAGALKDRGFEPRRFGL